MRQTTCWLGLTLVLLLAASSLAQPGPAAQDSKTRPSSKPPPHACFYNECTTPKTGQGSERFEACLKAAFPDGTKKVVLPGSPAFEHARIMGNSRFQRSPAAVVYAHKTPDVQAAVKCAYNNDVRVTVAGGRHSYQGWTVVQDFLVVDTSNMTEARVTGRQGSVLTVAVGAGNTNALLMSQLHKAGYTTAGTIIGQCPSVGVSGFILGGGLGDLSRMFGLACDQLVGLELVTYKGEVVTASAQHNSELLWASCGGGGALGVVSQWTIKAHDLGNQPFSRIMVKFDQASAIAAMLKLQDFIMSAKTDPRFSGGGAMLGGFNLYFAGPLSTAVRLLKEGGLLNPDWLDSSVASRALQSRAHSKQGLVPMNASTIPDLPSVGVALAMEYKDYYEAIMLAQCTWVASTGSIAGPLADAFIQKAATIGFGPGTSCLDVDVLQRFKTLAAQPASPINSGTSTVWRLYLQSACRLLPPLNQTAWEALVAVTDDPRCSGLAFLLPENFQSDPETAHYCFALNFIVMKPTWHHLLGAAVSQIAPSATAYPWRSAISPLCFDSGLPNDMLEPDGHTLKPSYEVLGITLSPAAVVKANQAVQAAYLKALQRALGEEAARGAYVNFQTDQVGDYEAAYWGPNYARLQQIKSKWDPEGVFSKPFTVQPAKT